ncbi:IS3 family transposase [Oceanobacillus neutriphilus]|uniref:IS3 family transposase n=1 Tax=Oceanobacillus neutriphilus TaxID=531815 RepID=UPI0016670C64
MKNSNNNTAHYKQINCSGKNYFNLRLKDVVSKYISFYNHQRFQKKLYNLSPYYFRTQVAQLVCLFLSN